jgi:hypothetical protein
VEVMRLFFSVLSLIALMGCGNSPELETGETKVLKMIKDKMDAPSGASAYIDARKIVSRDIIDGVGVPILFVEIDRGQNGTMTQYPGEGIGQTWLGVDGSTVTLENGLLKATRGMGDDLMGSDISQEINWSDADEKPYERRMRYLRYDNQTLIVGYVCQLADMKSSKTIELFDAEFEVNHFKEACESDLDSFVNDYYIGTDGLVRSSRQYHGNKIGYMTIARLDR